jgi:pimeloyl-ACP methyl ester carboxylesterase
MSLSHKKRRERCCVRFFSGFLFANEHKLFSKYLRDDDFTVAGFSHGAQKALEFALTGETRIDRLILLSPAFFQEREEAFKRAQKLYFTANKERYVKHFLQSVVYPATERDISGYLQEGSQEELDALLEYEWDQDKLATLKSQGVEIEVFLGASDRIIDAEKVAGFFAQNATVYLIKEAGHLLDIS